MFKLVTGILEYAQKRGVYKETFPRAMFNDFIYEMSQLDYLKTNKNFIISLSIDGDNFNVFVTYNHEKRRINYG